MVLLWCEMFGFKSLERFNNYRSAGMPLRFVVYVFLERLIIIVFIISAPLKYFFDIDIIVEASVFVFFILLVHYVNIFIIRPWMMMSDILKSLVLSIIGSYIFYGKLFFDHIGLTSLWICSFLMIVRYEKMIPILAEINFIEKEGRHEK